MVVAFSTSHMDVRMCEGYCSRAHRDASRLRERSGPADCRNDNWSIEYCFRRYSYCRNRRITSEIAANKSRSVLCLWTGCACVFQQCSPLADGESTEMSMLVCTIANCAESFALQCCSVPPEWLSRGVAPADLSTLPHYNIGLVLAEC